MSNGEKWMKGVHRDIGVFPRQKKHSDTSEKLKYCNLGVFAIFSFDCSALLSQKVKVGSKLRRKK